MKLITLIILISVSISSIFGQYNLNEEIELGNGGPMEAPKSNEPFTFVEQMPEFPGGEDALIRYLQKNIRYPSYAAENEIEGSVQVEFIVNEDGSIQNTKVVKGIKGGCDEEALRLVKSMPKWKPGKQGGHSVRSYYTVFIPFNLNY
jgi:protein TonB